MNKFSFYIKFVQFKTYSNRYEFSILFLIQFCFYLNIFGSWQKHYIELFQKGVLLIELFSKGANRFIEMPTSLSFHYRNYFRFKSPSVVSHMWSFFWVVFVGSLVISHYISGKICAAKLFNAVFCTILVLVCHDQSNNWWVFNVCRKSSFNRLFLLIWNEKGFNFYCTLSILRYIVEWEGERGLIFS